MSEATSRIAIFPGTFDPVTLGHIDLIRRGRAMFDNVVVAIGHNPEKSELFTLDERRGMIEQVVAESRLDVTIDTYDGLTVDFARQVGAVAMLRGIRNVNDLQFEFQLALTNRVVGDIETVFMLAREEYGFASSTIIRQIAAGGRLDRLAHLLPPCVIDQLKRKISGEHPNLARFRDDLNKR